jgi:hypothetical protein
MLQTASGAYYDTLIAESGCDSIIITHLSVTPTGVYRLYNRLTSFRISPNPFNSQTTIEFSLKHDSNVSLKIYDVIGQIIFSAELTAVSQGRHQLQFGNNISGNGLLIAEVNIDGSVVRQKLIRAE